MEVDTSAPATDPVAGEERCNSPLEKLVLEDENQEELDKIKAPPLISGLGLSCCSRCKPAAVTQCTFGSIQS